MNTTRIEGVILGETAKAYRLRLNQVTDDLWLPKSQLSAESLSSETFEDGFTARYIAADVPSWLARRLPWNQTTAIATRPW